MRGAGRDLRFTICREMATKTRRHEGVSGVGRALMRDPRNLRLET